MTPKLASCNLPPHAAFCSLLLLAVTAPAGASAAELPQWIDPNDETGASAAVVVGDRPLAHTAQMLPLDDRGEVASNDAATQTEQVLQRLDAALADAQSGLDRVIKLNLYVAEHNAADEVRRVLANRFRGPQKPAVALVVTRLPDDRALVAADAVATTDHDPDRSVALLPSGTNSAARPQTDVAVIPRGSRIYISGQAERSESLAEATRKTLASLRSTLRFLGRRDADIVQLKAFLTPMTDASVVQREVTAFFGDRPRPPLVLVEWRSGAATPIEIELIAWGGVAQAGPVVEYLTPPGMKASAVFSRVARINQASSIYFSGLYASPAPNRRIDPESPAAGEREVKEIFALLGETLAKAGSDLRHLVKATYYVSTDAASGKLNELRPKYYDPRRPPAASKAKVAGVGQGGLGLLLDMIAVPAIDDAQAEYGPEEFGHALSPEDAAEGWISLFDGKTAFGWRGAQIENGLLSGGETTTEFGNCELRATIERGGVISAGGVGLDVGKGRFQLDRTSPPGAAHPIRLREGLQVESLAVRPLGLNGLFNGRDMTGWKRIDRSSIPVDKRPEWNIESGTLRAVGGPGCVEYQGGALGDFILQLDVRTRVRHANGGVFFRAIEGDFMNGYEAQVYSCAADGDPDKPVVWCTGGIDDRQNARRLVSRDERWFRMTIIARGAHIATWVNGYQQTDFTDNRPPHDNPRQGLRSKAGVIQLQAHDPGTDVEFKKVTAASW